MVISALLLTALAVALCAIGIRKSMELLGLGAMQTLLWLGLAEVPAQAAPRRRPHRGR